LKVTGAACARPPRALETASHAHAALTHANAAFTPKTLDIASLKRTFVLDIGGGFDALMLPNLYKVLAKTAPGVRCLVSNTRGADLLEAALARALQRRRRPSLAARHRAVGRPRNPRGIRLTNIAYQFYVQLTPSH
jgi:hypothetical protein